jgi:hypothetical protein
MNKSKDMERIKIVLRSLRKVCWLLALSLIVLTIIFHVFLLHWYEIPFFLFLCILTLALSKIPWIKKNWWIVFLILFVINFPLLLNKLLFLQGPPTPEDLGNQEWLAFWASFIGSLIGGIATFIAVILTLNHSEKQNKKIQDKQDEIRIRDVYPFLDIETYSPKEFNLNKEEQKSKKWILEIKKEDFLLFKDYLFANPIQNDSENEKYTFKGERYHIDENRYRDGSLIIPIENFYLNNIGMSLAFNTKIHVRNTVRCQNKEEKINKVFKTVNYRMALKPGFKSSLAIILNFDTSNIKNFEEQFFSEIRSEKYEVCFLYEDIYKNQYMQKAKFDFSYNEICIVGEPIIFSDIHFFLNFEQPVILTKEEFKPYLDGNEPI